MAFFLPTQVRTATGLSPLSMHPSKMGLAIRTSHKDYTMRGGYLKADCLAVPSLVTEKRDLADPHSHIYAGYQPKAKDYYPIVELKVHISGARGHVATYYAVEATKDSKPPSYSPEEWAAFLPVNPSATARHHGATWLMVRRQPTEVFNTFLAATSGSHVLV